VEAFVLDRAEHIEGAVAALSVVEDFQVCEYRDIAAANRHHARHATRPSPYSASPNDFAGALGDTEHSGHRRLGVPGLDRCDRPAAQILLRLGGKPSRISHRKAHTLITITNCLHYASIPA
jgi:hypothetical protein